MIVMSALSLDACNYKGLSWLYTHSNGFFSYNFRVGQREKFRWFDEISGLRKE